MCLGAGVLVTSEHDGQPQVAVVQRAPHEMRQTFGTYVGAFEDLPIVAQASGKTEVLLNLDSSVGPRLKLVEASIGKGLRPIFATAPQFPLGGSGALEKSNVHSGLAAILGFNRGI